MGAVTSFGQALLGKGPIFLVGGYFGLHYMGNGIITESMGCFRDEELVKFIIARLFIQHASIWHC